MSRTRLWIVWGLIVAVLLTGCRGRRGGSSRRSGHLSIEIQLQEGDDVASAATIGSMERAWTSERTWRPGRVPRHLTLEVRHDNERHHVAHRTIQFEEMVGAVWPESSRPGEPIDLSFQSDLGTVRFIGETLEDGAQGQVQIKLNPVQVKRLQAAFDDTVALTSALSLIFEQVDAADVIEYAQCDVAFDILQAGDMARWGFGADTVTKLVESDHAFDAEDFLELARYRVPYDDIVQWKEHGYRLSAKQIVYGHNRNLKAAMAKQWKDVGYDVDLEKVYWTKNRNLKPEAAVAWRKAEFDLTLDQLYWIKNRNLDPKSAIEWAEAGYDLDLDELYYVKNRNVRPNAAVAWKEAGYDFDLERLYWVKNRNLKPKTATLWKKQGYNLTPEQLDWAKNRNVTPDEAGEWKQAGYNLSLEDLYDLDRYNVSPEFGAALSDPAYEPLTVKELIKLKRANLSQDMLKKLRRPKQP